MKCEDYQTLIMASQSPDDDADFCAHRSACQACQEFQFLWGLLRNSAPVAPPKGMEQRFHRRLAEELSHRKNRFSLLLDWRLPLAAAAVLVFGSGLGMGLLLHQGGQTATTLADSLQRRAASDRIITLSFGNSGVGNREAFRALMDRVERDPSPQVRMLAVEALNLYGTEPEFCHRIEAAIPHQTIPEVQLALIDLMGALRQQRGADALRRLLRQGLLSAGAQQHAELRLSQQAM